MPDKNALTNLIQLKIEIKYLITILYLISKDNFHYILKIIKLELSFSHLTR